MMDQTLSLLPTGFRDTLPGDAALEYDAMVDVLDMVQQFGYHYVKTPLLEYEESLVNAHDPSLSAQTFRILDPESKKNMALRADITPQISRIAHVRLQDEPRPLRLCYGGQVVRVKGEGLHAPRQWTQVGWELFGQDNAHAETEIAFLAVGVLELLGVEEITLDFSLPEVMAVLLAAEPVLDKAQLQHFIAQKDTTALRALGSKVGDLLADLLTASGEIMTVLPKLRALALPQQIHAQLDILEALATRFAADQINARLTLDPLDHVGFAYYEGVAFSIFCAASNEELGRGGRYRFPYSKESAVGVTLEMDAVTRVLPEGEEIPSVYVPVDVSFATVGLLQEQGYVLVRSSGADSEAEAKALGCTHIWQDDAAQPL